MSEQQIIEEAERNPHPGGTGDERGEQAEQQPREAQPVDPADAPEEDNVSKTPQDHRPPHQTQPPFKEQY